MPINIEGLDPDRLNRERERYSKNQSYVDAAIVPHFSLNDMAELSKILLSLDDKDYVEYITACGYASI